MIADSIAPTEIPLDDSCAATDQLNEQRKRLGLEVWQLEANSGVSASAFFAWKSSTRRPSSARSPSFTLLVAVAQALGYSTILRSADGVEHRVMTAKEVMAFINVERRRSKGLTMENVARAAGVSAASMYPIQASKRDTRVKTIVALAAVFGAALVLQAPLPGAP